MCRLQCAVCRVPVDRSNPARSKKWNASGTRSTNKDRHKKESPSCVCREMTEAPALRRDSVSRPSRHPTPGRLDRLDGWRKAAYDGGIADTPDGRQKAFVRSRKDLVAAGDVKCNDDLYWFTDAGKQSTAAMLNTEKRKQQAANADI